MAKMAHLQTNFTAGEITPRMKGRGDVARYQNGADTIENGVVLVHGGVLRRHGSRYLATAKHAGTRVARLVKYVSGVEQSFVLEFGHGYVRIFDGTTGAQLLTPALAVLELASPYTEDQLAAITHRQTGDSMLLFHPDVPTQVLRRLSATLWTLLPVRWIVEPFAEIGHLPDAGLAIDNPAIGAGRTFTTSPVTAPGAPTSPVATPLNGGARVNVTAPASTGGSPITEYEATASPGGLTGTSSTTSILVPGLTNGVAYTFTARARNKSGFGAASVATAAVTPDAALAGASLVVNSSLATWGVETFNGYVAPTNGPVIASTTGTAPFSFLWEKISGGSAIQLLPSTSRLAISSEGYGTRNYATMRGHVTDALGMTGFIDVPVAVLHKTGATRPPSGTE